MAKNENKFTYNVKGGSVSGVFNIYQDRKGALRMLMGNRHIELTFSQINDLRISIHDLIDFEYDDFRNYYNQKAVEEIAPDDRKWICQLCGELVYGRKVTFEEYHEGCGGRCV